MRGSIFLGASIFALSVNMPVWAQDAGTAPEVSTTNETNEIIVTA